MIKDYTLAQASIDAYSHHTWSTDADIEALVGWWEGEYVIAFRGTEFDFEDILRDIRGVPWYDNDLGWCHSGFLKGARSVWPHVKREIQDNPPYVLTGHSLGGALALIVGAMMVKNETPPKLIVTFGAPRPAFGHLGDILKDVEIRQYKHGNDCVTSHPWPLWGFRHPRDLIQVDDKTWPSTITGNRYLDHKASKYKAALYKMGL